MEELLLAESKRVVELLTMLNELPSLPEYNRDWKWNDEEYRTYRKIKEARKSAKNELKSRLTMLRKDCILVRKQLEEER